MSNPANPLEAFHTGRTAAAGGPPGVKDALFAGPVNLLCGIELPAHMALAHLTLLQEAKSPLVTGGQIALGDVATASLCILFPREAWSAVRNNSLIEWSFQEGMKIPLPDLKTVNQWMTAQLKALDDANPSAPAAAPEAETTPAPPAG